MPNDPGEGNWQADHVIIGGWRPEAPPAEKIEAALRLLDGMPTHLNGRHLQPYQHGRDRCGVLKVRFETPAVAAQPSFVVAQRLQAMPPPSNLLEDGRPW